ncbi:MAG TPA: glucohydrolase, partial [Acholeplasmatales bacterium]
MERKWWEQRNIYQIYLRSFFDTDGDGKGDIQGVIAKLPYLTDLGIGVIWISPHYDSPMDDNGYDVRDYYAISEDYGTLDDFRTLLAAAHKADIKVIADLVLNHTSDEHAWFCAACDPAHPDHAKYHDYYIWQKPKKDAIGRRMRPTRWIGWFGSPAWDYNEATDEYYLHIFSKKMPDLNWRNPALREEMKKMIRWWLDLGLDGFRVDASNHLEKNWDFPDTFPGYENFSSIPKHHDYLQELGKDIFVPRDVLTVGESGGATKEEALKYCGYGSGEFNMLIQFGHCWADIDNHHPRLMGKWAQGKLDVRNIKRSFMSWYEMLQGKGWNVIYWHNHDQPRVVSHYGDDGRYLQESAKMLAIALYFMPGTAIVYQGEEIGMTNVLYDALADFRDVEVFTEYQNMLDKGYGPDAALQIIKARCRDNARTPMQWSSAANGGFSSGTPWIKTNLNYPDINVAKQTADPASVLALYRTILNLRKHDPDIMGGVIRFLDIDGGDSFDYLNEGVDSDHLVVCNFSIEPHVRDLSGVAVGGFVPIVHNYPVAPALEAGKVRLRPYEAVAYVRR